MIREARARIEATLRAEGIRVLAPTLAPTIDEPTAQVVTQSIESHDTGCGWIVTCQVFLIVPTTEPGSSDDDLDDLADIALPALDRVTVSITASRGTYRDANPAYIATCGVLVA
jgi:hypothetical protein